MTKNIKHHLLHIKIGAPMLYPKHGVSCSYNRVLIGPELIQEMEEQIVQIRLKEAQDRKKRYADAHRSNISYDVGDHVFFYIIPNKSTILFKKGTKLSPHFIGPFEILERIEPVSYRLAVPPNLHKTHNVFHVSVLGHYIVDETHKLHWKELEVSDEGNFKVKPLRILDRMVQKFCNRHVDQVKFQWDKYSSRSTT